MQQVQCHQLGLSRLYDWLSPHFVTPAELACGVTLHPLWPSSEQEKRLVTLPTMSPVVNTVDFTATWLLLPPVTLLWCVKGQMDTRQSEQGCVLIKLYSCHWEVGLIWPGA
jgi:hypothetical protein